MKNKKYLLSGAAIVVLIIIIYFAVANKSEAPVISSDTSGVNAETAAPAVSSGGGAPVKTDSSVASSPQITQSGVYIVSYENSGFKPNVLEIMAGTSIRFINNSTKAMRIGTSDTTNNSVYQALNQPKTVGKGSYYDYNFVSPGVYEYLNLNNTADKGTITVK